MFIVNPPRGRIKVVPAAIFDLLTPVALAHWISGDGLVRNGGVGLATDSYTIKDYVLLVNVLIVKYNLDVTLYMHAGNLPKEHETFGLVYQQHSCRNTWDSMFTIERPRYL